MNKKDQIHILITSFCLVLIYLSYSLLIQNLCILVISFVASDYEIEEYIILRLIS